MSSLHVFTTGWDWEPSVIIGCIALEAGYLAIARFRFNRHTVYYTLGVFAILFALVSPLDSLGDDYLFSAHMIQHILLDLLAPPLLLLGIPSAWSDRFMAVPFVRKTERVLGQPFVAWFLGVGTLWLWHLPYLYNATLASETVHIIEHMSFMVTGTIMWWPAVGPARDRRLAPLVAVLYLYSVAIANTLLGALLTFAPVGLYPGYVHPEDPEGILSFLRDTWHLSPEADQQFGGLFMWVIGGIIFLWAIIAKLMEWYHNPDTLPAPSGKVGLPPTDPRAAGVA